MNTKCKYPKLDGKITEVFGTRKAFAAALGISETSIGNKMNDRTPWKVSEIDIACKLLGIDTVDAPIYFFG